MRRRECGNWKQENRIMKISFDHGCTSKGGDKNFEEKWIRKWKKCITPDY